MFTQTAFGLTHFEVVPGTPHCGPDDTGVTITWRIILKYRGDALDKDGFLLDNTAFKGYMTGLSNSPIAISCERMAIKIARDVAAMGNAGLESVAVTLSPFVGVEIEYKLPVTY